MEADYDDAPDFDDDDDYDDRCWECGGEGFMSYMDAGPMAWGEDCPSEADHFITCPYCGGDGRNHA